MSNKLLGKVTVGITFGGQPYYCAHIAHNFLIFTRYTNLGTAFSTREDAESAIRNYHRENNTLVFDDPAEPGKGSEG